MFNKIANEHISSERGAAQIATQLLCFPFRATGMRRFRYGTIACSASGNGGSAVRVTSLMWKLVFCINSTPSPRVFGSFAKQIKCTVCTCCNDCETFRFDPWLDSKMIRSEIRLSNAELWRWRGVVEWIVRCSLRTHEIHYRNIRLARYFEIALAWIFQWIGSVYLFCFVVVVGVYIFNSIRPRGGRKNKQMHSIAFSLVTRMSAMPVNLHSTYTFKQHRRRTTLNKKFKSCWDHVSSYISTF